MRNVWLAGSGCVIVGTLIHIFCTNQNLGVFSSTSESDRRKFRESVRVCVLTRLDSGLPTGKNVWTFLCRTYTVQQSTELNYCPLKTVTCRHFRLEHSQREKTHRLACDKTGIFIRAPDRLSKMCSWSPFFFLSILLRCFFPWEMNQ